MIRNSLTDRIEVLSKLSKVKNSLSTVLASSNTEHMDPISESNSSCSVSSISSISNLSSISSNGSQEGTLRGADLLNAIQNEPWDHKDPKPEPDAQDLELYPQSAVLATQGTMISSAPPTISYSSASSRDSNEILRYQQQSQSTTLYNLPSQFQNKDTPYRIPVPLTSMRYQMRKTEGSLPPLAISANRSQNQIAHNQNKTLRNTTNDTYNSIEWLASTYTTPTALSSGSQYFSNLHDYHHSLPVPQSLPRPKISHKKQLSNGSINEIMSFNQARDKLDHEHTPLSSRKLQRSFHHRVESIGSSFSSGTFPMVGYISDENSRIIALQEFEEQSAQQSSVDERKKKSWATKELQHYAKVFSSQKKKQNKKISLHRTSKGYLV